MIATLAGGHISGAHINPAATVSLAVMGMFPWSKVCHYLLAQYLGSIAATLTVYVVYYDAINAFNQTANLNVAAIFTTFPGPGLTVRGAAVDQVNSQSVNQLENNCRHSSGHWHRHASLCRLCHRKLERFPCTQALASHVHLSAHHGSVHDLWLEYGGHFQSGA